MHNTSTKLIDPNGITLEITGLKTKNTIHNIYVYYNYYYCYNFFVFFFFLFLIIYMKSSVSVYLNLRHRVSCRA